MNHTPFPPAYLLSLHSPRTHHSIMYKVCNWYMSPNDYEWLTICSSESTYQTWKVVLKFINIYPWHWILYFLINKTGPNLEYAYIKIENFFTFICHFKKNVFFYYVSIMSNAVSNFSWLVTDIKHKFTCLFTVYLINLPGCMNTR